MNIDTEVIPPDADEDGDGGERSARLSASLITPDGVMYDAAVQFFGVSSDDPREFADALLNVSLALASMRGSEFSWAVMQRLAAYDGMPR